MMNVKKLEWNESEPNWFAAEGHGFPWGYEARITDRGTIRVRAGNGPWRPFDGTIEDAKLDLQKDYEKRVMMCISGASTFTKED